MGGGSDSRRFEVAIAPAFTLSCDHKRRGQRPRSNRTGTHKTSSFEFVFAFTLALAFALEFAIAFAFAFAYVFAFAVDEFTCALALAFAFVFKKASSPVSLLKYIPSRSQDR